MTGSEDSLSLALRPYLWGCSLIALAIVIGFVVLVIRACNAAVS